MIVFGPIPSRRLGRSLGINNIPTKTCSYSCTYCQIGRTNCMLVNRTNFYSTKKIYREAKEKIRRLTERREIINYLTFVPDGEPTLDINLGSSIERLKEFGIKVAVITNSSLLREDIVKNDLRKADLVSLKIDTVFPLIWKKLNRPHGQLVLNEIMNGILDFSGSFNGTILTETMLIQDVNDSIESLYKTAEFIRAVNPDTAYLLVPTRPPAEKSVQASEPKNKNAAFQIFSSIIGNTSVLDFNEGVDFSFTSDTQKELLSILSVHPMRKDAVEAFLKRSKSSWKLIQILIDKEILRTKEYAGNIFFIKNN